MPEKDDTFRGCPRPPGNKYETWSWKEIQAALTGGTDVNQEYRNKNHLGDIADPKTLEAASRGFVDATDKIREAAQILIDGTERIRKEWTGPAGTTFCNLMLRVGAVLDELWIALADGSNSDSPTTNGSTDKFAINGFTANSFTKAPTEVTGSGVVRDRPYPGRGTAPPG